MNYVKGGPQYGAPKERTFKIECPSCKKPFEVAEGQLHPGNKFPCSECGAEFTHQGDDARAIADLIDGTEARLKKALSKL